METNQNQRDKIVPIQIEEEMKKSYIDYAMSVIIGRALPDVRDGLKPVHRRILYSMNEISLHPNKPYRKSAAVVGDVLAKYHPHGDTSVYDAMVKMAQDFSMRYPLVDGQGNFGSIDGDGAAAMRYTEARMDKLALELLKDIDKDTVDFVANYDDRLKEPSVLPAKYPNLLVNGSNGIAVGMATSIPPHNLAEVIEGSIALMKNPDISVEELNEYIKGPDFPLGGVIMGIRDIKEAYRTGRGKVKVRSKVDIEDMGKGKSRIIVTEIPYQVNKSRLLEKIAELVKDKKVEGISDLRDESSRHGIRIVVEVKKDVNPNIVLNKLYKHSQLEDTYSIIMLALVNGEPKILSLKGILTEYIAYQKEVLTRKTSFELQKAQKDSHLLEGIKIAIENIDEIISTIKSSNSTAIAKESLMNVYSLSEEQSSAILDMRLQKLTGLERDKIENEYNLLQEQIKELESILACEERKENIIQEQLEEIKSKYNSPRRSEIAPSAEEINIEDLIEDEEITITLTHFGYIKRVTSDNYKSQKRGGKGITALSTREEDFVEHIVNTTTHSRILLFTNKGRMYKIKAYEIPEGKRQAKGTAVINIVNLEKDEKITALVPIKDAENDDYLLMCTKKGILKKTLLSEFRKSKRNGILAVGLKEDDELIAVKITNGNEEIVMVTKKGMAIRFDEKDVRPMQRTAMGVKGITLNESDEVVDVNLISEGEDLLIVSKNGYGKRSFVKDYRIQNRAGKGLKTYNINEKTGEIAGAKIINEEEDIMIINSDGVLIRLVVKDISRFGRITSGVRLMRSHEDTQVVSIAKIIEEDTEEE